MYQSRTVPALLHRTHVGSPQQQHRLEPADSLIYASIPGSVAAPLGNASVSVNPPPAPSARPSSSAASATSSPAPRPLPAATPPPRPHSRSSRSSPPASATSSTTPARAASWPASARATAAPRAPHRRLRSCLVHRRPPSLTAYTRPQPPADRPPGPSVPPASLSSYRATTITDGTHLAVAIPASHLAAAGKGTRSSPTPRAAPRAAWASPCNKSTLPSPTVPGSAETF